MSQRWINGQMTEVPDHNTAAVVRTLHGEGAPMRTESQELNRTINTLIMAGMSATEATAFAERQAIREHTRRFGFDRAADRYGEDTVRAAWLPED
jgi:hypothetical protein